MKTPLRPAIVCLVLLTILTGVLYPLAVTAFARIAFPRQAEGSILNGSGSELIGQSFDDPKYFWGRLSATPVMPFNAAAGSGSNLSAENPILAATAKARIEALKAADPANNASVPVDLVTASGSGLDPDISPAAAQYQAARVARARRLPLEKVREVITEHTRGRQLGLLGEPRVNVLQLNLALDRLEGRR